VKEQDNHFIGSKHPFENNKDYNVKYTCTLVELFQKMTQILYHEDEKKYNNIILTKKQLSTYILFYEKQWSKVKLFFHIKNLCWIILENMLCGLLLLRE